MNADKKLADAEKRGYERGYSDRTNSAVREAEQWRKRYTELVASVREVINKS